MIIEFTDICKNKYKDLVGMWAIYKICNRRNNVIYIGKSSDLRQRWRSHHNHLIKGDHENEILQSDFNKMEPEDFFFEILEFTKQNITELSFKELYNIYSYSGKLYNKPSDRDYKRFEISKILKENKIYFDLCFPIDGLIMDFILYDDTNNIRKILLINDFEDPLYPPFVRKRNYCFDKKINTVIIDSDPWKSINYNLIMQ